ncbi:MAG: recombinase family protein [Sedimentibacter sp.]
MENIAIYMRLSKEDEYIKDESNSITSQRLMLLNYVSADEDLKGNNILQFVDDGYSGTNLNRPGMQDMLKRVREEQIKCVIVKDFSRFSRDHIELGSHIEQIFPFMGVRFIAVNDGYDSKETLGGISGLSDQFKMLIYDYYSKDLSEKVKTSMAALKKQGKFVGGHAPFGYIKDPSDKSKILVDDVAAKVIRKIFKMALDGNSLYQISKILNEEGVVTPAIYMKQAVGRVDGNFKNHPQQNWTVSKVKRILDNEMYLGNMVQGKLKSTGVGSKRQVHVPEEEWIRVPGTHEAIISKDMFEKAKKIRADGFYYGERKHESHVLKGKVFCGGCGKRMVHSNQGRPKYVCNTRYYGSGYVVGEEAGVDAAVDLFAGPGGVAKGVDFSISKYECEYTDMIRDEDLEAIVIRAIEDAEKRAVDMVEVKKMADKVVFEKRKALEDEINGLDLKIAEMDQVLMEMYEDYREEKISKEEYLERKVELEEKVLGFKEKIRLLEDSIVNGMELQVKDATGLDVMGKYLKVEKLTKELVDVVVERVVVGKGNVVEVVLKIRI